VKRSGEGGVSGEFCVVARADQRIRQHTIDGRQRQHMVAERIEDMAGDYRGVH
jgi:hypothetical protein